MAVLLTGGAGFIGSHTCVELINAGEQVILFDNFINSVPDIPGLIGEITGVAPVCYTGNLLDEAALARVFKEQDIQSVIHFAGLKAVGESAERPLDYYTVNVGGSLKLLHAMKAAGCRRIVFSSSATVYGIHNPVPYVEGMPVAPANTYGRTKAAVEHILEDLASSDSGWSVMLLRYFNPVGAHASGLIGENPQGIPNNLTPYIGRVAAGLLPMLNVFGNDYDTPDGTGVRDYIHVLDLARGHLCALNYAKNNTGCEAVNLGTGRGYSVLDVLHSYERACGRAIPYEFAPRREGDLAAYWSDTSKARKLFGWSAEKDLDEMCADAWNFASKRYV